MTRRWSSGARPGRPAPQLLGRFKRHYWGV
ncbi:hypothetical protein GGE20_006475, partial [Rhizobium leguminosarum]|nr:hypothetical protein [Rhizobium leguminosarum]